MPTSPAGASDRRYRAKRINELSAGGFTTIEVVLAILLLLILASLCLPSFVSMMEGNALREDAGMLISACEAAKEKAIIDNGSYSVILSGERSGRHIEIASGERSISRFSLSEEIDHSPSEAEIVFHSDGRISSSTERIIFESEKGRSLVVIIDDITGKISTAGADQKI